MKAFWVFLIIFVIFLLSQKLKSWSKRREYSQKLLMMKWRLARRKRECWKADRESFYDFNHPDYQKLWEIEIGAEVLYIMKTSRFYAARTNTFRHISWTDWQMERRAFNKSV